MKKRHLVYASLLLSRGVAARCVAALAFVALAVVVTTFSACQSTEEGLDDRSQGSIPLVVGTVTVGTPATVGTRVAIGEGATGYTGIRKSRFVEGDAIELQVTDASAVKTHTITLDGSSKWLFDSPAYVLPGSTMTATYTSVAQQAGIPADNLSANSDPDGGIILAGGTLTLGLKHAGAMIDVTPVSGGAAITSVTLNANIATVKEEADDRAMHYRTIVAAGSTDISTITAEINRIKYVATLATPITPGANKCYPINLTFKNGTLTATANAPQNWTDGGEIKPGAPDALDYDRFIDSPEALAQFAKDVNDNTGSARTEKVLQVGNIDMSQLMTATDANTAAVGGKADYNYTATKNNWVPIGVNQSLSFTGSYNGNGYTISNVKMTEYPGAGDVNIGQGFFGTVSGNAQLTSIHLRDFNARSGQGFSHSTGALVGLASSATISLCSATGKLEGEGTYNSRIGGLIGGSSPYLNITRCTSRVNVTIPTSNPNNCIGGFGGDLSGATVVGCSSVSALNITGMGTIGGFCGKHRYVGGGSGDRSGMILGCYAGGTIVSSNGGGAFCGAMAVANMILAGCYSDVRGDKISDFVPVADYDSSLHNITYCAWAGSAPSPRVLPVSYGVAPAGAYAAVTAKNVNNTNAYSSAVPVKTLHWSVADGYTLTPIAGKTWSATGIWKYNPGALPTINLMYEGE